jgi:hypothetical protein
MRIAHSVPGIKLNTLPNDWAHLLASSPARALLMFQSRKAPMIKQTTPNTKNPIST